MFGYLQSQPDQIDAWNTANDHLMAILEMDSRKLEVHLLADGSYAIDVVQRFGHRDRIAEGEL
jgi:hypothetical protein